MIAVVRTAFPLAPEEKRQIADALQNMLGEAVTLEETLDPALIAGIEVEAGGRVLEYSLRSRLEGVRRELLKRGERDD